MEKSLSNINSKNNEINKEENNKNSISPMITNIAINQSLSDTNKNQNILNNEIQIKINKNFDKNENSNNLEDNNSETLKESSDISSITSRKNNKNINVILKEENKKTYNKRLTKINYSYLNRFIDYEKRKESKLSKLKMEKNYKEEKTLKQKPLISRKSVELISKLRLNDDILERMNYEEKKTKDKKAKLIQKINIERERKKKEIEKPHVYNISITKFDNKFDKIYNEMMKKQESLKSKINAFSNMVREYEMRECYFQPNISKNEGNHNEEKNKKKKRIDSSDVINRLYHEEIKNRRNRINKLNEKYKLTFKPTISNKSVDLALKRREKLINLSKEKNIEENDI